MDKKQVVEQLSQTTNSKIRLGVTDLDGMIRGKLMHKDKVLQSLEDGFGFCNVIFGWDSTDSLYEKDYVTGWNTGFPDAAATIDTNTFRIIPWHGDIPMLLADFEQSLPEICPRTLLKKQQQKAHDLGFETAFAMELEWFNFKKDQASPTIPVSKGMFGYSLLRANQFQDFWGQLFDQLATADIPLEGLHTETGPGAQEAAIMKTDVLEAADRTVLFKSAVKEMASQYDILSSFMAKWSSQLPGCSGHLHQSFWKDGQNLFASKENKMSMLGEHYLAGLLYTLPDFCAIYAPTINSYKRLVPGSWAPTTVSWGVENRTTACRIINRTTSQSRIELRVPGADNNPYLSIAAALASGLYGIENKLTLDMPEVTANAYEMTQLTRLPSTLKEATSKLKSSEIASELLGESFVAHFVMTREWEVSQHEQFVSNWETERYLEGI